MIERLLAKDPDARPTGAAQVEQELAVLGASPASSSAASVSDLSTAVEVRLDDVTHALPRSPTAPPSTAGMSALPRRRYFREIALAAVLALLGAAIYHLLQRQSEEPPQPARPVPAKTLRVVVPKPQIEGDDERLALAASGVLTASLNALGSLEGVAAVDPLQLVGSPKSPVEMARSAAVDEVVVSTLEKAGNLGRITLRRIQGSDGRVLWTDSFDASMEAEDLRALANAVGIHLRRGYPGRRQRTGTFLPDVRDEDYATFLKIKQRVDAGGLPSEADLVSLGEAAQQSPPFLEARILAAQISWTLFQSTKETAYRDRALAFIRQARGLAPEDPRPLQTLFRIEIDGDRPEVAAAALTQLESLLPGDPQILALYSRLAEHQGHMKQALVHQRSATERLRSWRNLYRLADLEIRTGRIQDARRHLGEILSVSPKNIPVLEKLAQIELVFGDLKQAEQIYLDLAGRSPQSRYFSAIGVARVLMGRSEDAITPFRQSLAIDPDDVGTTINLADAELSLGHAREAEAHYRRALQRLEKNRPPGGLNLDDSMAQAQCLAHLGRTREAVEITQRVLGQNPEDPYLLQSVALVYALVGDRASALVNAQNALEKGVQPRWLTVPAFAPLQKDPEFRRLLDKQR